MMRGLFIAPFDELVDPRVMAGVAAAAEEKGWDGLFVWDHIVYRAPVRAVADPWIVLSAVACATQTMRLGPLVTPLARRRIQKLARETVTLDLLSGGRLILGVGLGSDNSGELGPFGEELDPKKRAVLFDDGLERLAAMWGGEFEPAAGAAAADPGVGGGALAQPPAGAPRRALGRAVPDRDARSRGAGRARAGDDRGPRRRRRLTSSPRSPRGGPRPVGAGRGHVGAHRVRAPAAPGRGARGDRRRALRPGADRHGAGASAATWKTRQTSPA